MVAPSGRASGIFARVRSNLAGLFEAPIERIELVGPGLYRLTAGRCRMDIRMVVVRGGPGEGLAPPRTEPRPGPRICEP